MLSSTVGFAPGCVKTQKREISKGRVALPDREKIAWRPFCEADFFVLGFSSGFYTAWAKSGRLLPMKPIREN
jgi:hypothetical protein